MPLIRMPMVLALAAGLTLPFAALAEEGGTMSVMIGGKSAEFPLDPMQSDWSNYGYGGSVSLYAGPPTSADGGWTSFSLGFEFRETTADIPELRAVMADGGEPIRWYADAEDSGLAVSLTTAEINGDLITLQGSFEGEVATSGNFGRDLDPDGRQAVSGSFDVTVEILQ